MMKTNKFTRVAAATIAASALMLTAMPSANAQVAKEDVPSFAEFEAATFQDVGGQYVVNGDEVIANAKALRAYYDQMVATPDKNQENGLVVNTNGGVDDKWSASQAGNLTYCVSTAFGSDYAAVVSAMQQGAGMWESASSGVNFTYVSSADSNCTVSNNSVLFSVEPTSTNQYIARAFFPSTSDSQRNVLVNAASLQDSGSWTPGNILGHEHTRPEAGTCFEDNNWRPLTAYDSSSIMHYPQCNGSSADLSFTATDGEGVRAIYGS